MYFVSAKVNSLVVDLDLPKSGFVPNEKKSHLEPLQIIIWLGVILNTIDGTIKATDERIQKLNAGLASPQSTREKRQIIPSLAVWVA